MFITALDIGSSKIKALVAEVAGDGKLFLAGVFKIPSAGVRKGEIVDFNETTNALSGIFNKIKELNKSALKNIFVNINSAKTKCQISKGFVAVSRADNEISSDDIERAVKSSQTIRLSHNRTILHNITREFIIDGVSDIRDPLGMAGARLEVSSLIIDSFSQNIKDTINCVKSLNGGIGGLIYGPLASARSVLTKIKKNLGTVLIDIGAQTTGLSVYEEGKLLHAATFPVGSAHITNDLAIGLKCSVEAAELIKIFFGQAQTKEISGKEKITSDIFRAKTGVNIKELDKNFKAAPSKRFIAEIIEVRLAEIFEFIHNELKLIGQAGKLPAGAVITGGGAEMPLIVDLAKNELKLSAEIGIPDIGELDLYSAEFKEQIENPELAAAVGLLLWGRDEGFKKSGWPIKNRFSLKKILRYFEP